MDLGVWSLLVVLLWKSPIPRELKNSSFLLEPMVPGETEFNTAVPVGKGRDNFPTAPHIPPLVAHQPGKAECSLIAE